MDDKIIAQIEKFKGDIPRAFEFLHTIYNNLGFRIPFDVNGSSSPEKSFASTIRNYRRFGLLNPVGKDGRKLSLNGRNMLQFLLIQRFLWEGVSLKKSSVVAHLSDADLKNLVLDDNVSIVDLPQSDSETPAPVTSTSSNLNPNLKWYHFKLFSGVNLQVSGQFDEAKICEIRTALTERLKEIF